MVINCDLERILNLVNEGVELKNADLSCGGADA